MFPLDAPPDTSAYMIAGYTVFFIVAAIYIVSLAGALAQPPSRHDDA